MCRKLKMFVSAFCELCFFDFHKIELMSNYKCRLSIRANLFVEFSVQKISSKDYSLQVWVLSDLISKCYRTSYSDIEHLSDVIRDLDASTDYELFFNIDSLDDLFGNQLCFKRVKINYYG